MMQQLGKYLPLPRHCLDGLQDVPIIEQWLGHDVSVENDFTVCDPQRWDWVPPKCHLQINISRRQSHHCTGHTKKLNTVSDSVLLSIIQTDQSSLKNDSVLPCSTGDISPG